MSQPPLRAAHPRAWLEEHLSARQRRHDADAVPEAERRWVDLADLLRDDATHLREAHLRVMTQDGAPPPAAAKWVASWYAGQLADAVGYVYAAGHAAMLVRPDLVRFGLHPEGWAQLVDVTCAETVVVAGHPWDGLPGVRVVADDDALAALVVDSLVTAVTPVLEVCRTLGKVGWAALWAEVADALGLTLLHQLEVAPDPDLVARLRHVLDTPGAPWGKRPELGITEHDGGLAYVGRKGGCCLAYQCTHVEDDVEPDPRHEAYLRRFPPEPSELSYCSTCSLRDLAGCVERQLFWLDEERAVTAPAAE